MTTARDAVVSDLRALDVTQLGGRWLLVDVVGDPILSGGGVEHIQVLALCADGSLVLAGLRSDMPCTVYDYDGDRGA